MCLAVQSIVTLALTEQVVCESVSESDAAMTSSTTSSMSCLLQRQTSVAKAGAVAEILQSSAETGEEVDEQMTEAETEHVKKKHKHNHHKESEEMSGPMEILTPSTTDEWSDYLVDGKPSTTTAAVSNVEDAAKKDSDEEGSFLWKLLCWIDFLHWFTPAPGEEAVVAANVTNTTANESNDSESNETTNETTTEAPSEDNETSSNKTELNDTNTTKKPHAPLPASLKETPDARHKKNVAHKKHSHKKGKRR